MDLRKTHFIDFWGSSLLRGDPSACIALGLRLLYACLSSFLMVVFLKSILAVGRPRVQALLDIKGYYKAEIED